MPSEIEINSRKIESRQFVINKHFTVNADRA